jgi:hypothetical protein
VRKIWEARTAIQPPNSNEEIFVLPDSDDIDEKDDAADQEDSKAVEWSLPFGQAFEGRLGEYLIHIL